MSHDYYICRKENYGSNGNFTRFTMVQEYDPGLFVRAVNRYRNWCLVFCFLVLALVFSTWYYQEKSTHCMSDQQIANYVKEK